MNDKLNKLKNIVRDLHTVLSSDVCGEDPRIYGITKDFEDALDDLSPEEYFAFKRILDHVRQFLFVQTRTPVNVDHALLSGVSTLLDQLEHRAA